MKKKMKRYLRLILLFSIFSSLSLFFTSNAKVFADPLPSSYRDDADYYYWDAGKFYWYGNNTSTYETGNSWYDTYPVYPETLYNNIDWMNIQFDGFAENNGLGFQSYWAIWSDGQWAIPNWNYTYSRYEKRVTAWYKRAKTTPYTGNVSIFGPAYQNGNDYWYKPNTNIGIRVDGHQDYLGGVQQLNDWVNGNYLNLQGSGQNWVAYQTYGGGHGQIFSSPVINTNYGSSWGGAGSLDFYSDFYAQPTADNLDLAVNVYLSSANGKSTGSYIPTGQMIRTDGTAPSLNSASITGARYQNGNYYWIKPNDSVNVNLRQFDGRSGNKESYLRIADGTGVDVRSQHVFSAATNYNNQFSTNSNVAIGSALRTENSGGYGTVQYGVTPTTSGHIYGLQYYFIDNVGNDFNGNYADSGMKLGVDGDAPTVQFRTSDDTADFTSRDWSSAPITVKLKFADVLSGYKQSRYAWTQSPDTPTSGWSSWSTDNNYNVTMAASGQWYLHVQAQDNVGNTVTTQAGVYKFNTPPVAQFNYSPNTIYNDTTVSLNNTSYDVDAGQTLTYQWAYQQPGSTTWVNFSTAQNPTNIFNIKGTWNIRLTVSDGIDSTSTTQTLTVQNRPPVPNFSFSPSTIYNDTTVTFTNSSADADKDPLTYIWEYQKPGTTTWTQFSTAANPTQVLNMKGTWNIRLTATDDSGASVSIIKSPFVSNRPPVPNFSFGPGTIYNDTTVQFTNSSTDPDNDPLTYKWEYQQSGASTWTQFSTAKDPTQVLNIKGTWNIRLTVTDDSGASTSIIKSPTVQNRPPVPNFSFSPSTIYNDTTVTFTNSSADADKDPLTYIWEYQKPGTTTWTQFSTAANPTQVLNMKGTWNIRLTATDDSGASVSIIKSPVVSNRPPVPNFSFGPATIYNDTSVSFTNSSTDPDKDPLTYIWEYQQPGATTWTQFSTSANPTQVLNMKGTWNIRLTVTDDSGASVSVIKSPVVSNRPPVANFSYSPSKVYNDTIVQFTNSSTDPDKDPLTYQWSYQQPGATTWTNFSTAKDPTQVLNQIGTWGIKLTVTDDSGASQSFTQTVQILNRPPVVNVTYTPLPPNNAGGTIYEGDTVRVCATVQDPDGQTMSVNMSDTKDGITSTIYNNSGITSGSQVCSDIKTTTGRYDVDVKVGDGMDVTDVTTWFYANPLSITGTVSHTPDWEQKHIALGHGANSPDYYSGETFLLSANTSPYPIDYVKSTLVATQSDGAPINSSANLSAASNILYTGSLYDAKFLNYPTNIKPGPASFVFEVKYSNGVIKQATVNIQIIENVFSVYRLHSKF